MGEGKAGEFRTCLELDYKCLPILTGLKSNPVIHKDNICMVGFIYFRFLLKSTITQSQECGINYKLYCAILNYIDAFNLQTSY